jgi:uncharacterized protein (DUF305 family)
VTTEPSAPVPPDEIEDDGGVSDEELAAFDAEQASGGSSRTRVVIAAMAIVAIVVAAAIGFSVGRLSTLADPTPSTTSAEAGFSRDMQVHHNQGVELAMIIRDRTDAVDVRTLAYDIATTQAQQSGQLYDWLVQWNLPQGSRQPDMTWMTLPTLAGASGHAHGGDSSTPGTSHTPGDPMPGLATPAQIDQLTASSGLEAERLFLTLMIAHHRGAVEMAEALQPRTTNATALAFASAVIASQQAEIDLMTRMLDDRGGPVPLAD